MAPTNGPTPPGGRGLAGVRRKPALLLGGGAAAVVVVVALIKRQSANNAANTSTTAANPQQGTYDSSLNDIYNQFENQLEGLQATIAGLQQQPTTGTSSSTPVPTTPPISDPDAVTPPSIPGGSAIAPVPAAPAANSFTQTIYKVVGGDTLSAIAARYGETWQQVYNWNLTPGVRDASSEATVRSRGPNLIFPGESIYIPNK